jgi:hypothetical protein
MNKSRIAQILSNQKRNILKDYAISLALLTGLLFSAAALF